jgi:hypothetical protein
MITINQIIFKMRRWIYILCFIFSIFSVQGCASMGKPVQARMYNLQDGTVINLEVERSHDHGKIKGLGADGEIFEGEYSWQNSPSVTVGMINGASAYGVTAPGSLFGVGVIRGNRGTIIELQVVSSRHGHGGGDAKDNRGKTYRIQF